MRGYIQGQVLQLLRENHEDLEEELETVESAEVTEERRVCHMRVCAAQAGGTGGEEQGAGHLRGPPLLSLSKHFTGGTTKR